MSMIERFVTGFNRNAAKKRESANLRTSLDRLNMRGSCFMIFPAHPTYQI